MGLGEKIIIGYVIFCFLVFVFLMFRFKRKIEIKEQKKGDSVKSMRDL